MMRVLRNVFGQFPPPVRILLVLALARSVSFFALLPFLPIYLHDMLGLDMAQVGYVLGLSLLGGTLTSIYSGYLADKFDKVRFMILLNIVLTISYLVLPRLHDQWSIFIMLLLVNTGSAAINIAGNALFSEQLPQETRAKAFSLRYALQNIGAVIGPFFGAWATIYYPNAPFMVAAAFTLLILVLLLVFRNTFISTTPAAKCDDESIGFGKTLMALQGDRRLVLFTLGGILSMVVYGPLLTYLSQYLVVVETAGKAYEAMAYVSAVNAALVISLQYIVGTWIKKEQLLIWVSIGSFAFMLGLLGLSFSTTMWLWMLAILVFTLGEIIIAPVEFMFIDMIAPDNLRGSYFGAQNLVYTGVAIGPIVCGFLLKNAAPSVMFYALIGTTMMGWTFYYVGCRNVRR